MNTKFKLKIGHNEYDLTRFRDSMNKKQFDEFLKDVIEKNAGKSLITKKKEEEYLKYLENKYREYMN